MSHFSVLVIGENPENQLAPYHEFECTGIDDQYVVDVDITDEVRSEIAEHGSIEESVNYHIGSDRIIEDESDLDLAESHKYGYAIVKNGSLIKAVNRTNQNKKWDWYQLGGRWGGFFKHKNGQWVDVIKKGDIDLPGMIADKAIESKRKYEQFANAIAGHEFPKTWPMVRQEFESEGIDAARKAYAAQPAIKALTEAGINFVFACAAEHFGPNESDFVYQQTDNILPAYAVVQDSNWYAKGEMDWFGISTDEITQEEWNAKISELINSLPNDTMLSMYDCHI